MKLNVVWLSGGRSEKGAKKKGASACVQTQFPCLLIVVLYTAKDGSPDQRALLYQDSLQATGVYSQVICTTFTVAFLITLGLPMHNENLYV